MSEAYVGEIRSFGFNFPPSGWMLCQGQILSIAAYETLFTLLGTTYGGDGSSTFAIPDLRGRAILHQGTAPSGTYPIGQALGQESVTLVAAQVATHSHNISGQAAAGGLESPANAYIGGAVANYYSPNAGGVTAPILLPAAAPAQPHANLQPYLCINYSISLYGVYPSRN